MVDRKIAEALEDSDARYRFLAETLPVQIWTSRANGQLDYVTEQTARQFGLTSERLLSDGWQNVVHPDDLPLVVTRWTHSLQTGEPYEVEFRLKLADGSYAWHLGRATAQKNSAGQIVRWFGTNTNIEEQRAQTRRLQIVLEELAEQTSQLKERGRLLALEAEIGVALTRSGSLREALGSCASAIVRHLDAAFARIWMTDDARTHLVLEASAGLYTHLDGPHGRVPIGDFKIGMIASERKPHLTNDVLNDSRVGDPAWAKREGMVSFAGYPLLLGDSLVGVIAAFAKHPFSESSLATLGSISNGLALAIERRRSEEKLRTSEAWLSTTLTSIGDGVIATDAKGVITFMNPVATSLTGFTEAEASGQPLDAVFPLAHEETRVSVLSPVAEVLRDGVVVGMANHTILRRRDGVELPVDDSAAPIRDRNGNLAGVVLVFRDASEKRKVEAERARLLAQEQSARRDAEMARAQLHSLFMQTPAAIAVLRGPTHIAELVNPYYKALIGSRDVIGMPIREALPELAGQKLFELLDEVYLSQKQYVGNEVSVLVDRTGTGIAERLYLNFVYQPHLGPDNQIQGIMVFAVEVTAEVLARREIERIAAERKDLLDARKKAERELERIFDLSIDLLGWSKDGVFLKVNPAFTRLLGFTEEELCARPIFSYLHPEDVAASAQHRIAVTAGATGRNFDCRFACKDGTYRWLAWSSVAEDGIIYSVARDVTAQKAEGAARAKLFEDTRLARETAEKANQAMDEFLATVSHELRTPLNAMLGWTRLLRSDRVPDAQRAKALETIERNASIQAQLIEDLLDISRIISGKLRLDVVPVELVSTIESALDVVRPAADAKGVRLNSMLDPAASHVTGDSARLQQVIWNLLSNAVKFTPKGGRVEIRLSRVSSAVEIGVTDTGQGIEASFLPYVFERFRQADGASTRAHGGLGLGLAIVKNIVELHGGTVRVESDGPGKGAAFAVSLPISLVRPDSVGRLVSAHPELEGPLAFECPPQINGLHVLVVDDEADARELLVAILAQCGAVVTSVSSVAEALSALEKEIPAVLVSDIGMPHEDGYSLIRKIRMLSQSAGGRVPAVALTAFARAEDRTHALRAGFNMHVPKPIEPTELLAVIASLAERSSEL